MIEKMIEEAFEGNYTSFSELFKEELGRRIHERLEDMKSSVIDNTYNVCESCDPEEDEEEYFDVDEDDVYEEYGEDDHNMDPKTHVKKDKEGMFVVYHKNGKAVEKFDNKKEADAYAMKNHDDLMKEAYHSKKKKVEAMDPVGQEDGDIDNDGDKDSSDKYLMRRRKAIGKAMKKEGSYGSKKAKSGGGY